eukprot:g9672.t1
MYIIVCIIVFAIWNVADGVEWDCAASTNTGTFTRSSDCTISGNNNGVDVTGTLEIVGSSTDMDNLVTISAASKKRHFYVDGANDKLVLRYVKLVGGDVGVYVYFPDYNGGSIYIPREGELQLYACIVSNNKADYGGGIHAWEGSSSTVKVHAENSILQGNSAVNGNGGGMCIEIGTVTLTNTISWFSDQYSTAFPLKYWEGIVLLRKFLNGWISLSLTNRLEIALPLQLTMCILYLCLTIIFQPFKSNQQLEENFEDDDIDDRRCGRHNNIDITQTLGEMFLYIAGIMNNDMILSFGGSIETGGTNGTAVMKRRVRAADMENKFPSRNMACAILEWIGVSLMLITTAFAAYEAWVDFTKNHKKSLEKIKGKAVSLVKILPLQ